MPRLIFYTLTIVMLLSSTARAEPLDTALLDPDAKWVVHLDIDALRDSTVGQSLIDAIEDGALGFEAKSLSDVVGIDLMTQTRGATVYGLDFSDETTVMLVDLKGDSGNLQGLMLAAPGYRTTTLGERTIHSFLEEDEPDERLFVCIDTGSRSASTRLLASHSQSRLIDALERLDAPGQAGAIPTPPRQSIFYTYVTDIDIDSLDEDERQHSAILEMIRELTLNISETQGQFISQMTVETDDPQKTEQLRQLTQGLLAMTQLMDQEDPNAQTMTALARQIQIQRDGQTLELVLETPAQNLADLLSPQGLAQLIESHDHDHDDDDHDDEDDDDDDEHDDRG